MPEDPAPPKVNYCPYCGEELPELQEFCPGCGVKLSAKNENVSVREGGEPRVQEQVPSVATNPTEFFSKQAPPGFISQPPVVRGIRCIHCKGTGFCRFCQGAGSFNRAECPHCGGTGRCMICNGRGVL